MKKRILSILVLFVFVLAACNNQKKSSSEKQKKNDLKSFISLFEIPATDISRAINFYQNILDIPIEKMEVSEMEMGVFPYKEQMVTGVIVKGAGYLPKADGVTIYLNGGNDLQFILDKVDKNGGKVLVPKTAHADGNGFFALFLDTEGNKLGLNSPN